MGFHPDDRATMFSRLISRNPEQPMGLIWQDYSTRLPNGRPMPPMQLLQHE